MDNTKKEDILKLYDDFLTKSFTKLQEFQKETQMEDDQLIEAINNALNSSMSASIDAFRAIQGDSLVEIQKLLERAKLKREYGADMDAKGALVFGTNGDSKTEQEILLLKKQVLTEAENTKLVTARTGHENEAMNLTAKQVLTEAENTKLVTARTGHENEAMNLTAKQVLTEECKATLVGYQGTTEQSKNSALLEDIKVKKETKYTIIAKRRTEQGVTYASDYSINYTSNMCSYKDGAQTMLLCAQKDKVIKDKEYVGEQKTQLIQQVKDNALIQAADKQADLLLAVGNAGLVPQEIQYTNFYSTINAMSAIPSLTTNIGKPEKLKPDAK